MIRTVSQINTSASTLSMLWLRKLTFILFGSLTIALGAQVIVPLAPVPITGQSFVIMGLAFIFGPKDATAMVAAYLLEGAAGLPVFAGLSHGAAVLTGPSGGYLLAFLPTAYLVGQLSNLGAHKTTLGTLMTGLCGLIVTFSIGVPVLALTQGWSKALQLGLYPFLIGDVLKVVVLAICVPSICKRRKALSHMP